MRFKLGLSLRLSVRRPPIPGDRRPRGAGGGEFPPAPAGPAGPGGTVRVYRWAPARRQPDAGRPGPQSFNFELRVQAASDSDPAAAAAARPLTAAALSTMKSHFNR